MEDLPEGPLASILLLTPLPESGTISVVCRHWHCLLRDVVHRTMTRELKLRDTTTVVTIRAIVARFRNLTSLNLSSCRQVGDVGVQAIGAGCPNLTSLDLTDCNQMSDVGAQAIGAGCPSLTSLDLTGCDQVSDVGVQAIRRSDVPVLQAFDCLRSATASMPFL